VHAPAQRSGRFGAFARRGPQNICGARGLASFPRAPCGEARLAGASTAPVLRYVEIRVSDLFESDFSKVTVTLLPDINLELRPKILGLKYREA
jgi:hypothetical protein